MKGMAFPDFFPPRITRLFPRTEENIKDLSTPLFEETMIYCWLYPATHEYSDGTLFRLTVDMPKAVSYIYYRASRNFKVTFELKPRHRSQSSSCIIPKSKCDYNNIVELESTSKFLFRNNLKWNLADKKAWRKRNGTELTWVEFLYRFYNSIELKIFGGGGAGLK